MSAENTIDYSVLYSLLARSSARKKIYAWKAEKEGRKEIARLLRAAAESEAVQARRIFYTLKGAIDTSDAYFTTILTEEIPEVLTCYGEYLEKAQVGEKIAATHMLSQLRRSETGLKSLLTSMGRDGATAADARYYICRFCGHVSRERPPEICPVCGAEQKSFKQVA